LHQSPDIIPLQQIDFRNRSSSVSELESFLLVRLTNRDNSADLPPTVFT